MHEYASITLNMIEYTGIDLKKQSAEYARILNVSDAVHSMPECRCATRNFSGQGGGGGGGGTRALR